MYEKRAAVKQALDRHGKKSVITEATKLEDRSYGTKITMEYED